MLSAGSIPGSVGGSGNTTVRVDEVCGLRKLRVGAGGTVSTHII